MADTTQQIQESQRIQIRINIKISTTRLIFKLQKIKDKVAKGAEEKSLMYRDTKT